MKKIMTALIGGVAVASVAFASASVLKVEASNLQSGVSADLSCDKDGVGVEWGLETSDNSVYFARVTGIDAACSGSNLFVRTNTMKDAAKVVLGEGSEAVVRFNAPLPQPEDIQNVRVWIEG